MFDYIDKEGRECRIYDMRSYVSLTSSGAIGPATLVRRSKGDRWQPLAEFVAKGLLDKPALPLVAPSLRNAVELRAMLSTDYPLVRRAAKAIDFQCAVIIILGILTLIFLLRLVWMLSQSHDLVAQYGYGYVPLNLIPMRWPYQDEAIIIFQIGMWFCFLVGIYRARKSLDYLGVTKLRYSSRWLIWSFFIPIVNLVRPWQGLGEVDRRLRDISLPKGPRGHYFFSARFSWLTAVLAIVTVIFSLVELSIVVIIKDVELSVGKQDFHFESYYQTEIGIISFIIVIRGFSMASYVLWLATQSSRLKIIYRRETGREV